MIKGHFKDWSKISRMFIVRKSKDELQGVIGTPSTEREQLISRMFIK